MTRIMFVCHGNICRSPMAEFILRDIIKKEGREDEFLISSSATSEDEIFNGVGSPVYPPAREELSKHGISCDGKIAVKLKKSDYEKYDLFICMDSYNVKNATRILGGDKEEKVRKLLGSRDVKDPWYSRNFEEAYKDIYEGCKAILENF